jgi:uncharacterized protein (TIGR02996 family)
MTTEDDFQKKLDEDPKDWQTRLVFADWLDERGDKRAEGYRALALIRDLWYESPTKDGWTLWLGRMKADWFNLLAGKRCLWNGKQDDKSLGLWRDHETRREAEDDAAFAFSQLPTERRTAILNSTVPV